MRKAWQRLGSCDRHPQLRLAIPPILSPPKGGRLRLPVLLFFSSQAPDAALGREVGRRTNEPWLRARAGRHVQSVQPAWRNRVNLHHDRVEKSVDILGLTLTWVCNHYVNSGGRAVMTRVALGSPSRQAAILRHRQPIVPFLAADSPDVGSVSWHQIGIK